MVLPVESLVRLLVSASVYQRRYHRILSVVVTVTLRVARQAVVVGLLQPRGVLANNKIENRLPQFGESRFSIISVHAYAILWLVHKHVRPLIFLLQPNASSPAATQLAALAL